jgi:hypothetical protein
VSSSRSEIYPVRDFIDKFVEETTNMLNPLLQELEQNLNIKDKLRYYTISEDQTLNVSHFVSDIAKLQKIDLRNLEHIRSHESESFCKRLDEETKRIREWSEGLIRRAKKRFCLRDDGQKRRVYLERGEAEERLRKKNQSQEESLLRCKQLELELQKERKNNELLEEHIELKQTLKELESKFSEATEKIKTLNEDLRQKELQLTQVGDQNRFLLEKKAELDKAVERLRNSLEQEQQKFMNSEDRYNSLFAQSTQLNSAINDLEESLRQEQQKTMQFGAGNGEMRIYKQNHATSAHSIYYFDQLIAKFSAFEYFKSQERPMITTHLLRSNLTNEMLQIRVMLQEMQAAPNLSKDLINAYQAQKYLIRKAQEAIHEKHKIMINNFTAQIDSQFNNYEKERLLEESRAKNISQHLVKSRTGNQIQGVSLDVIVKNGIRLVSFIGAVFGFWSFENASCLI